MKKLLRNISLAFVLVLGIFAALIKPTLAFGQTGQERPNVVLDNVTVTTEKGEPTDRVLWWETFNLSLNWDASSYKEELKAGDYFDIIIPDALTVPNTQAVRNFPLVDTEGAVVANAVVTTPAGYGGIIRVTFTDYVNNRIDVKGTLRIMGHATRGRVKLDSFNDLDFKVGGRHADGGIHIVGPVALQDEVIQKWAVNPGGNTITWLVRLNHSKQAHKNVVISDHLSVNYGSLAGLHYIKGSFKLYEVTYNAYGEETSRVEPGKDINDQVVFNNNGTIFEYALGDIDGKQYLLEYQSTYRPGVRLNNEVHIAGDTIDRWGYSYYESAVGSGTGQGEFVGEIKLIKVDAQDTNKRLSGAEFKLVHQESGRSYTLATNEAGEATLKELPLRSPGRSGSRGRPGPLGWPAAGRTRPRPGGWRP